jgi:signal transduction histidine kinase
VPNRPPSAQLPSDADRRLRLERILALMRLNLAALAIVVYSVAPPVLTADRRVVLALLLAYAAYAGAAALFVLIFPPRVLVIGVVLQCADILWALVITAVSEGPASAFFVFFVFALIAPAYRWGLAATLWTGLLIAVLLLVEAAMPAVGMPPLPAVPEARYLIVRCGYAIGLAFLIGYLAEDQKRARQQAGTTARVLGAIALGGGLRATIQAVLRELIEDLRLTEAHFVFHDQATNRLYAWSLGRPGASVRLEEIPAAERDRWLLPVAPAQVVAIARRTKGLECRDDRGRRTLTPDEARPFEAAMGSARRLLAGDLWVGREWTGRALLVDAAGPLDDRLRPWLASLLAQIGPSLATVYLVGRLRSRATAMERSRLARELHDGVIQSLVGFELQLDVLRRTVAPGLPGAAADLERLQQLLRSEVLNVRELIHQLRPVDVDTRHVPDALAEIVERFRRETGIDAQFVCSLEQVRLPMRTARELVRIVQEALVNVRRHSGAQHVVVTFGSSAGAWTITLDDDGGGFDFSGRYSMEELDAARRGPLVVKERVRLIGGSLQLDTSSRGTRIQITIPRSGYD